MKNIYYSKSKVGGLGVFTLKPIKKGEIIEVCPVVLIPFKQHKLLDRTSLEHYYFDYDKNNFAFCLGYGALYNHSYDPNAKFTVDKNQKTIVFTAIKDISKNTEILTNYNGDPKDKTPLQNWWDKLFVDKSK